MTAEKRKRLSVTWIAKAGSEEAVREILRQLSGISAREPGCLRYAVFEAVDDPRHFLLYEEYRDADALRVHSESAHFNRFVLTEAAPMLESRRRTELSVVADSQATTVRLHHVSSPYSLERRPSIEDFYGRLLGLKRLEVPTSLADRNLIWFSAGSDMELHFLPDEVQRSSTAHFCLDVVDLDSVRGRLLDAGFEPYDAVAIPGRPRFFCRDPCGNLVEFTTIEVGR